MSNEEENEGQAMFIPLPPAVVLAEMRRQHDQRLMEADDYHHSVARLLDSMQREQLETFRQLMHGLVMMSEGDSRANLAMYEGLASGILHARYKVCLACDRNHDEVMAQQMAAEEAHEQQEASPRDGGDPFKPFPTPGDLPLGGVGMLSDTQLAKMEEYGLDDLRAESDGSLIGFRCIHCGKDYISIEDRMRRPPRKDGCDGCVNKEKWG